MTQPKPACYAGRVQIPDAGPQKLVVAAILALLDGAPFGRLATYAPPQGDRAGRCYVVPLQFLHSGGVIRLVTTAGRKLTNLRGAPQAVCFALDLTDGDGWTSVCAWGDYSDVTDLGQRLDIMAASFSKYPEGTTKQAVSLLRRVAPGTGAEPGRAGRSPVFGRILIKSMAGRHWPGLLLSAGPALVHPAPPAGTAGLRRPPERLSRTACHELLAARPLVRLGCYSPARARMYCLPLWAVTAGDSLWFYHPPGGAALLDALRDHPQGVCAQVDNLDCSPVADPGQPWRSALAEGTASVHPLGQAGDLPATEQAALLRAIRTRLEGFAIRSVFVPPDPDLTPPAGALIRLRIESLSGQATGEPL